MSKLNIEEMLAKFKAHNQAIAQDALNFGESSKDGKEDKPKGDGDADDNEEKKYSEKFKKHFSEAGYEDRMLKMEESICEIGKSVDSFINKK